MTLRDGSFLSIATVIVIGRLWSCVVSLGCVTPTARQIAESCSRPMRCASGLVRYSKVIHENTLRPLKSPEIISNSKLKPIPLPDFIGFDSELAMTASYVPVGIDGCTSAALNEIVAIVE